MSRGPGRWQRAILEALQTREWILLWDVLPNDATQTQRAACRRAVNRLVRQGRARSARVRCLQRNLRHAERKVLGESVVCRPGLDPYAYESVIYRERVEPMIRQRFIYVRLR